MTRYEQLFKSLEQKKEGAFIPFVVLGDPNLELSFKIIETLIEAGADALELGLAFSDPVADGPVIQRADMRVISGGVKVSQVLELLKRVRAKNTSIPIGILTYANLVIRNGANGFYGALRDAGVDSLLIADVPTLEMKPFLEIAKAHEMAQVMIVPPNIDDDRLRFIAREASGYVYVVTRSGVTGSDQSLSLASTNVFAKLQELGAAPGIYGFGISEPAHVKAAINAGASGAISGSAITAIIEKHLGDEIQMLNAISGFAREMKAASILLLGS